MLLPNINTILNMDIQDINYPGFNRSLDELNAITKLKKNHARFSTLQRLSGLEMFYVKELTKIMI